MPSNRLILCHPLLLLSSIFSSIRVFPNELALRMRWPKCWSFRFSISPFSEYSGLISFRMVSFRMVWSPCSPKDSQESSPAPQCKNINSLALSSLPYLWSNSHIHTWLLEKPLGFPGGSDSKEFSCNAGDPGLFLESERFPGEGNGYTPVILPGEFHEQRSLVCYNPWGHKKLDTAEQLTLSFFTGKTIGLTIWPLSAKWCLCFLICCLGLSSLFFQGASIF